MRCRVLLLVCLLLAAVCAPAFGQPDWCWNSDYFTTSVANGTITVLHHAALYNCCPLHFSYSIDQQENVIAVHESEVLGQDICACWCCFDIPVEIGPLPPATYRIDFSWQDYETGLRSTVLYVTVPGRGQGGMLARSEVIVPVPICQHTPPAAVDPALPSDPAGAGGEAARLSTYPNPVRGQATIEYELRAGGEILLELYAAGGTRVRVLAAGRAAPGVHQAVWDGLDDSGAAVPAGVYFCRLRGDGASVQQRLVLVH
jgi:hypothetical protein